VKIITRSIQSKNPVLIEGFPGIGLVGNIASQHMIDELNMEHIGSIKSRYFPSIAVLYEGLINMPVRIYENLEHNLIIVISDIPIIHSISYDVSNALVDWAKSINVREFVSIAGIAVMDKGNKVFGAATTPEMLERIRDKIGISHMGSISGISGSIMSKCLLHGIPALNLLGATMTQNPDSRAASNVIEVLNELYGLSLNTQELIEQAERIEIELKRLADDVQANEMEGEAKNYSPMYE